MNKAALWDHGSTKLNHEQEVSHNYLNTHINHKAAQRAQNCCMLPIAALVKITLTKYYHGKQSCSEFKCWALWKQEWSSLASVQLRSETHQDQIKAQVQYVVQSLKMASYFSLLTQSYVYGMICKLLITVVPSFSVTITCNYFNITALSGRNNVTRESHFICCLAGE